eukprot:SAG31_NODE_11809_length_996_cov_1.094760_1_plen_34_part_10
MQVPQLYRTAARPPRRGRGERPGSAVPDITKHAV